MKLKKIISTLITLSAVTAIGMSAVACKDKNGEDSGIPMIGSTVTEATPVNTYEYDIPQDYCRTYYEIFVGSFADGNGDGKGDLKGLIANLDYLNDGDDATTTDLGINGIWLMPIHQSSSYHKYNVDDYYSIDSQYGTMTDFENLVEACDERDIWLQIDLVLNHTSNKHTWFQAAVEEAQFGLEPDDPAAVNMQKYSFKHQAKAPSDGMTWRKVPGTADYWYLGNFSDDMPDVNLSNPDVRAEIENIVEFWLEKGVRSFRLDAVPSAFGTPTSAAYIPANAEFWTWFNTMCAEKGEEVYGERYPGLAQYCYNVGEVWSSTATVVQYYDSKMSCFNYGNGASASAGFSGVVTGNVGAAAFVNSLETMQSQILEKSDAAMLSNFLSCHDNNRSAGYFGRDTTKIKNAAALYMLMSGNPYIYYGEEIGAIGTQTDPNRRLHFNWGGDKNVQDPPGATFTLPQSLGSVADQTDDVNSILTYYRQVIQLRNRFPEIGRGVIDALAIDGGNDLVDAATVAATGESFATVNALNKSVAAYTLTWNDEKILIVHNVGEEKVLFNAAAYSDYEMVAHLHASGGKVGFADGKIALDGGTVMLLKAAE